MLSELRRLRDCLETYQDRVNNEHKTHTPIPLTVTLMAELINKMEEEDRNFCQERRK